MTYAVAVVAELCMQMLDGLLTSAVALVFAFNVFNKASMLRILKH